MGDPMQDLRRDFTDHVIEDAKWKYEQEQRWKHNDAALARVISIQETSAQQIQDNQKQIHDNQQQINQLTTDTQGLVTAWKNGTATAQTFRWLGSLGKYLTPIGAIGVGIWAYVTDFFGG